MSFDFLCIRPYVLPYVEPGNISTIDSAPARATEIYESYPMVAPFLLIDHGNSKAWRVKFKRSTFSSYSYGDSANDSDKINRVGGMDSANKPPSQEFELVDDAYQAFDGYRGENYNILDSVDIPAAFTNTTGSNQYIVLTQKNQHVPLSAIGFNDSSLAAALSTRVTTATNDDSDFAAKFIIDTANQDIRRIIRDSDGYFTTTTNVSQLVGMATPDSWFYE